MGALAGELRLGPDFRSGRPLVGDWRDLSTSTKGVVHRRLVGPRRSPIRVVDGWDAFINHEVLINSGLVYRCIIMENEEMACVFQNGRELYVSKIVSKDFYRMYWLL